MMTHLEQHDIFPPSNKKVKSGNSEDDDNSMKVEEKISDFEQEQLDSKLYVSDFCHLY